jgi:hypothetical protein
MLFRKKNLSFPLSLISGKALKIERKKFIGYSSPVSRRENQKDFPIPWRKNSWLVQFSPHESFPKISFDH